MESSHLYAFLTLHIRPHILEHRLFNKIFKYNVLLIPFSSGLKEKNNIVFHHQVLFLSSHLALSPSSGYLLTLQLNHSHHKAFWVNQCRKLQCRHVSFCFMSAKAAFGSHQCFPPKCSPSQSTVSKPKSMWVGVHAPVWQRKWDK